MSNQSSLKNYLRFVATALAISGSALLVVNSTNAQPVGAMPMDAARMDKMLERHVDHMAKAVSATPEQKAKLLAIAKAAQADIKPLHEQISKRMEQAKADSKNVLTPEQRTQWEAKIASRQQWMEHRLNGQKDNHTEKHD